MSIRDAAEQQEQQTEARHEKEAAARPDLLHRAVIFLLKEVKQNNPDAGRECEHYKQLLDAELGNPELIAVTEGTPAAPPETAGAPAPEGTADSGRPRQSRRFTQRS